MQSFVLKKTFLRIMIPIILKIVLILKFFSNYKLTQHTLTFLFSQASHYANVKLFTIEVSFEKSLFVGNAPTIFLFVVSSDSIFITLSFLIF